MMHKYPFQGWTGARILKECRVRRGVDYEEYYALLEDGDVMVTKGEYISCWAGWSFSYPVKLMSFAGSAEEFASCITIRQMICAQVQIGWIRVPEALRKN
jgi:hypothetical protein